MLNQISLAQLACRASNLTERLFLLKQLSGSAKQHPMEPLTLLDLQIVEQNLEILFPRSASVQKQPFYAIKRRGVRRALRLFRWYERNLLLLSAAQQQLFLSAHASWIQTYEQALAVFSTSHVSKIQSATAILSEAWGPTGCAPFLMLIETELMAVFETTQHQGLAIPHKAHLVLAAQQFFSQRVAMMVTPHLEESLFNLTAVDADSAAETYHGFYLRFPVLARWLAQVCGEIIQFVKVALGRLLQDHSDLSQRLWARVSAVEISKLRLRQEDMQGQWIGLLDLRLANGQESQITYYPYALEAELGLQKLYAQQIPESITCQDPTSPVICRSGYGYISTPPPSGSSRKRVMQQFGQFLALQQLLGNRGLWRCVNIGIHGRSMKGGEFAHTERALQRGFKSMQQWLFTQPRAASKAIKTYFNAASVQMCNRSPAAYLLLLVTAQQPARLRDPLAVDAVFRALIDQPCSWDKLGEIAQLEVKMLWQFKALCITVPMNHRYMLYDADHVMFSKLPLTPLEFLTQRLEQQDSSILNSVNDPAWMTATLSTAVPFSLATSEH